jgi:spoIIIJ-associated protein
MEWVETTGRTVAEALDAALDELGVDEDDVEYEVVEEPRTGLLGRLGGREARIRARVKPISREKPGDRRRRDRKGRDRAGGRSAGSRPSRGRGGGGPSGGSRERSESGDGRRSGGDRPSGGGSGGSSRRRGGRRRQRPASDRANEGQERNEGASVESDVPIEEQAQAAREFTQGLTDAFGADATVDTRVEDEIISVDVTGDELGLLVGPRGATLSAIEELVRTVVQRQTGGHGARINVDVAGYRAKRREALSQFTRQLVEKVLEDGTEQALEPMSASDRKVVHDAAAEIDGVETVSEGEDPRRRVVIRPV